MNKVHYTVSGLGSSVNKTEVKNALDKVNGVQQVCVDLSRGTVEVIFNDEANEESIKNCIIETGFELER